VTARESGALRIFAYNWPVYAGTWMAAGLLVVVAARASSFLSDAALLAGSGAALWSFVSLAVSFSI
jgi:hypothetical protein